MRLKCSLGLLLFDMERLQKEYEYKEKKFNVNFVDLKKEIFCQVQEERQQHNVL